MPKKISSSDPSVSIRSIVLDSLRFEIDLWVRSQISKCSLILCLILDPLFTTFVGSIVFQLTVIVVLDVHILN